MKKMIAILFLMSVFLFSGMEVLKADTSDNEYKVIKNALKNKRAKSSKVTWLRISVKEGEKEKVMIKFPIALVELFASSCKDKFNFNDGHELDLKKVLKDLTKNGPQTLIEIKDDNETVKIWLE